MSVRFVVAAVAAGVAGYFSGGSAAAATFSLVYGTTGFLDPNTQVQGPRLDDLKLASASYGAPIAYIEGHPRVPGNIVWCTDKREVATTVSQGKGGPGVDSTTFTYECDMLVLLAENPGLLVRRIWSNGALVWSAADDADAETLAASAATTSWREIRFYDGDSSQLPDPTYEAAVGLGNAPAYRGRSSLVIVGLNLGNNGQLPVLTFEAAAGAMSPAPASSMLDVPFTDGTANDVADDPITPSVTNSTEVVIEDGRATFLSTGAPSYSGTQYSYAGPKLSALDSTRSLIAELTLTDAPTFPGGTGTGNTTTVLALAGLGVGANIGFRVEAGVLKVATIYVDGANTYVVMYDVLSDRPVGSELKLKIVINDGAPGNISFYFDDTQLRTIVGGPTSYSAIYLGASTYGINQINGFVADSLVVHYDDVPSSTTGLALQDADLQEVVERQWVRSGLEPILLDASALADMPVHAMAVSQITSPRQVLDTLAATFLFEFVESDLVRAVLRGGAPAISPISYEDLGASASGETAEPLPLTRGNELELTSQVTVKFSNVDDDYQDGSESSTRLATGSSIVSVSEVPLGLTPTEAKRLADISVTDALASITRVGPIVLTRKYAHLEPTDVVPVTGKDGSIYRARFLKRTDGGGILTFEGVLDDASAVVSEAVTSGNYTNSTVVRSSSTSADVLLDIPILRDSDSTPGIYGVVKAANDGRWKQASIFSSRDGVTYDLAAPPVTDQAVFGVCTNTLGDWTGLPVFDEMNGVTVDVGAGELASVTRDALLNDQSMNAFAIGRDGRWEIGQFRTATLQSPGVYRLSGLLRGLRGTEWAMVGHSTGERFVLLQPAGMRRIAHDTSDLGMARYYKTVTGGRNLASATAEDFTDTGVGLKPFSPVDVRASRNLSGDITLTWQRRSRLAVRTTGPLGISVPLGEDTEAYVVDVFSDSGFATLRRSLSSSVQSAVYTADQQVADFGALQGSVCVRVYQLSAVVGRGYPAQKVA